MTITTEIANALLGCAGEMTAPVAEILNLPLTTRWEIVGRDFPEHKIKDAIKARGLNWRTVLGEPEMVYRSTDIGDAKTSGFRHPYAPMRNDKHTLTSKELRLLEEARERDRLLALQEERLAALGILATHQEQ